MLRAGHKTASLLPRPLGLVEDLNLNKNYLANLGDNWFCWLLDDDCALLRPLGTFFGKDTAPFFIEDSILSLFIGALLGGAHDASSNHLDHLVGELTKSAASTSTTTAASATSSGEVFMRRRLLLDLFLLLGLVYGSHDD